MVLQLYHPENVYIILVGVEVWTNGDLINVNGNDYQQTLADFRVHRYSNINPYHNNDNGHLITLVSFSDLCLMSPSL